MEKGDLGEKVEQLDLLGGGVSEERIEYKIPGRTFDPRVNRVSLYKWLNEFLEMNGIQKLKCKDSRSHSQLVAIFYRYKKESVLAESYGILKYIILGRYYTYLHNRDLKKKNAEIARKRKEKNETESAHNKR